MAEVTPGADPATLERTAATGIPRSGSVASLPLEVEELLADVVADGFAVYCCGPRVAPNALVAAYEWAHYVDLVTIRTFDRITAARVPKPDEVDIFAPETAVWAYDGPPQQALRALLNLAHPTIPTPPPVSSVHRRLCIFLGHSNAR